MQKILVLLAVGLLAYGWGSCAPSATEAPEEQRLLLLLRHSKDSKKKKHSNFQRPLTKKGEEEAQAVGAYLKAQNTALDCIVSSSAKRAKATAQLVAKALDYPMASITLDSTLYKCKTRVLIETIQALDDSCKRVLVVGHNPSIIQTANHFQRDTIFMDVPKSGLIGIGFSEDSWSVLGHKEGVFRFFWTPL